MIELSFFGTPSALFIVDWALAELSSDFMRIFNGTRSER